MLEPKKRKFYIKFNVLLDIIVIIAVVSGIALAVIACRSKDNQFYHVEEIRRIEESIAKETPIPVESNKLIETVEIPIETSTLPEVKEYIPLVKPVIAPVESDFLSTIPECHSECSSSDTENELEKSKIDESFILEELDNEHE
jgi:hypothetical protein